MFGKEEEVRLHSGLLHLEHLGADIGLLGDSVIDDKGLNIEGIGANLRVAQLVLRLQPRPPRRLTGAGDQQGFVFQPLQGGDIGMGQQPLGIVLKGRGNGLCLEAALNAFQQLQVVTDDHIGPLRQQQLHAVDLRSTGADLDVETVFFVQPGGLSLIITPLLRLGVPGGQQNDFLLGLNGQRDTAEGHQAQPAYAPGKACACFHIPLLFTPGGGASECGSASHPGQH